MDKLVAAIASAAPTVAKVSKRMLTVATLGIHLYNKDQVSANALRDLRFIVRNFDWKENMTRGHGPVEDAENEAYEGGSQII